MKLPLELVEELVLDLAGKDAVSLVRLIKDKENVSEFKIADKLKITVNQTMNILYRLGVHSLVDFTRKKDRKKGLYIYFWTFSNRKALELIIKTKKERITELRKLLKPDANAVIYKCPNDCLKLAYPDALEHGFKCPDCNSILTEMKAERSDEKIKQEMEKLREELESEVLKQPLIVVEEEEIVKKPKKIVKKIEKKKAKKAKSKKAIKKKTKKIKIKKAKKAKKKQTFKKSLNKKKKISKPKKKAKKKLIKKIKKKAKKRSKPKKTAARKTVAKKEILNQFRQEAKAEMPVKKKGLFGRLFRRKL